MAVKKKRKWIVFIVIAVVLIAIGIALVALSPMLMMSPTDTGGIPGTEILAVKNSINSLYFIPSGDGYILIDAGTNASGVEKGMEQLSIAASDIQYVLLTHSDYDHVGALNLFAHAQIFISEDEVQMLDGTTERNPRSYNDLPEGVGLSGLTTLEEGQEISLDEHVIRCITTPGHTPGSMTYLLDGQYLFTGDAVRVSSGKMLIHPFTMDETIAEGSVQKIAASLESDLLVMTAHYGYHSTNDLTLE